MRVVLPRGEAAVAKGMWGHHGSLSLICSLGSGVQFLFWCSCGVWVLRGVKSQKSTLTQLTRVLSVSGCCHARSKLYNAHIITFELVRSGEIRLRDGFCAELVRGRAL